MAPPPPATVPLPDRLLALAKTLQFSWFMGHLTLLLCTIYYTISVFRFNSSSTTALVTYRTAFLGAAVTYGIVVYKAHKGRFQRGVPSGSPQQQGFQIISDENVQYLFMALVWLYSKPIWFALLPFAVYSTFHFLTYLRSNVIPTFIPPTITSAGPTPPSSPNSSARQVQQHPISEAIAKFVKQNYDGSMHLVSNLEIFLLFRLIFGTLFFINSWVLLLIYAAFLRVRYSQSAFVRQGFQVLEKRVDSLVSDPRVPKGAQNGWETVKNIVHQITDATNLGKVSGDVRKAQ